MNIARIRALIIRLETLFEMAELSDISEEDFIKSGAVNAESAKKNTDWIKNIKNYTEETKLILFLILCGVTNSLELLNFLFL